MSVLTEKSEENYKSAKYLYDMGCHNSVIHCAYYSIYQLICHICSLTRLTVKGQGSHDDIIRMFTNDCRVNHRLSCYEIQTKVKKIKALRKTSDYSDTHITAIESKDSLAEVEFLLEKINRLYNVRQ